jgi:hypothetical protein
MNLKKIIGLMFAVAWGASALGVEYKIKNGTDDIFFVWGIPENKPPKMIAELKPGVTARLGYSEAVRAVYVLRKSLMDKAAAKGALKSAKLFEQTIFNSQRDRLSKGEGKDWRKIGYTDSEWKNLPQSARINYKNNQLVGGRRELLIKGPGTYTQDKDSFALEPSF